MQFPIVDFTSPGAPAAFCDSLHRTGFGVLKNHPLDHALVSGIYDEWLAFFATHAKHRYPFDKDGKLDGYFSTAVSETAKGNTVKDLKEFFHIYPWGRYPAEVSDAARALLHARAANWPPPCCNGWKTTRPPRSKRATACPCRR